ncbi:hypothetical protein GNVKYODX_CDS74 [Acinetobacter phage vB_AbaM_AB3P2]|nr:hypothetical protein GNVKYODX_CDS74 [Acinetobacter phage vB_AbaM_AB3P2]
MINLDEVNYSRVPNQLLLYLFLYLSYSLL